jgi:spore germination protein PB
MNLTVYQQITIGQLRITSITNSSMLQIGSAGSIRSLSQLYNTGGFAGPAPQLTQAPLPSPADIVSLVPLPGPR